MNNIKISNTSDYFLLNNDKFFYLADTVWSAFTNAGMEEWEEYLDYRRIQGFNALQINILPQWDRSRLNSDDISMPAFNVDANGDIDFYSMNKEYFIKASMMTEMAVSKGFIPALVVLWGDYVEFPWALSLKPNRVFPIEAVEQYVLYVLEVFSKYNPIYLVSGDNNFKYESTHPYFLKALEVIKKNSPESITTLHMSGETSELPHRFIQSPYLDFYMYQSGHSLHNMTYKLALDFTRKEMKKPVVNGEISYEGIRHLEPYQGRMTPNDIRRVIWQSLLSGAKAGVTYGAHGLWSWHRKGNYFPSMDVFDMPFDWRTALHLKGAWDASFAKWIFETFDLFDIAPSDMIVDDSRGIRAAKSDDGNKIIIYSPYSTDIRIKENIHGYECTLISLEDKYYAKPTVVQGVDTTLIKMHEFNSDVLFIGIK